MSPAGCCLGGAPIPTLRLSLALVAFSFRLTSPAAAPTSPRIGTLTTSHGEVRTPAFMPVGTLATVKSLAPAEVAAVGAEMLLVNAYHLYLRPGHHLIARLGGVHRFMDWPGPILSDSGGFQVFSLARISRVDDSGVRFRSHIDGSEHHYTPELAMEVQAALGVDIAMPLDHVLPGQCALPEAADAAGRTLRWYERSRSLRQGQALFAIVQGGVHPDLRREQGRALVALGADGYAIGGLSVGESKADTWEIARLVAAELPTDRPRYLMGVGSPEDLVTAIGLGVDMFDCVLPTRLGRNGALFTDSGRINIANAAYREDPAPIDTGCDCAACSRFSAAYLHHLFRNQEMLGYRLASLHNLRYLAQLLDRARSAIEQGRYDDFAREFAGRYRPVAEEARSQQTQKWLKRRAAQDQHG